MSEILRVFEELKSSAEKSMNEEKTRSIIRDFMAKFNDFKEELIGSSIVYEKISNSSKPLVGIRGDFDGVLTENGGYEHRCGHHGHTTILLDLARKLHGSDENVLLLFQAGEETAEGAPELIRLGFFEKYHPDVLIGIHNFPGFREHEIILKEGCFNYSVIGFKSDFIGKPSHAAYPEHGRNPIFAMGKFIGELEKMNNEEVRISITHTKLGEFQYGTSSGGGVILGTIRSEKDYLLAGTVRNVEAILKEKAEEYQLEWDFQTSEYFKGVVNSKNVANRLRDISTEYGFKVFPMGESFRAGEDFGFYLDYVEGCYIGIGTGIGEADLHTEKYCLKSDIIDPVSDYLKKVVENY